MDIETNRIKEYEILRSEIEQKIELHNTLLTFTITTVVAILSFVLLQEQPYNAFLFLIPFCILIPMSMRIAYYRSAMAKLSAYMIVFLEKEIPGIQWETLNQEVVSSVINSRNKNTVAQKKRRPFAEGTKAHKLLLGRYYECLILGILCYILYAVHYYQDNELCPLTLFNLGWPIFLIVLEVIITVAMDSVDRSKKFWVEQWETLKKSKEETSIDADAESEHIQ